MPQITYRNVTGGQTFGDAGSVFRDASSSLNRAVSQAQTAVGQVREGAQQEQDRTTEQALTQIQGVKTADDAQALRDALSTAGGAENLFQGADANRVNQALQNIDTQVRTESDKQFDLGETDRLRSEARQLREAQQGAVAKSPSEIRASITPNTPAHIAAVLHEQADKAFTRKQNVTSQEKDDFRVNTLSGLQPVNPDGDILSFEAKEDSLRSAMDRLRETGKFTPAELNTLERENRAALGLTPEEGLSRLFASITDPKTGNIVPEFLSTDSKTGETGLSFSKFSKEALDRNFKRSDIQAFKKTIDDFTGKTARDAEARRQQIRAEGLDDFKSKEQYKALLKQEDPARITEVTDILDDSDDWLGLADSSKVEAIKAFAQGRQQDVPVSSLMRALSLSISGEDDFNPSTFQTELNALRLVNPNEGARPGRSGRSIIRQ